MRNKVAPEIEILEKIQDELVDKVAKILVDRRVDKLPLTATDVRAGVLQALADVLLVLKELLESEEEG